MQTAPGVYETNPVEPGYHDDYANAPRIDWTDKRLAKITRFRLLSDFGYPYWDVSYVHGVMRDGTRCHVTVPFRDLPKRALKATILAAAKRDGVYAKGIGIFDALSTLI